MKQIIDDYDSNKPEEALDASDIDFGEFASSDKRDSFICPDCGSTNCKNFLIDGDDHRMREEIECLGCGSTFTD